MKAIAVTYCTRCKCWLFPGDWASRDCVWYDYHDLPKDSTTKYAMYLEGYGYWRTNLGEIRMYSTASNARRAYANN